MDESLSIVDIAKIAGAFVGATIAAATPALIRIRGEKRKAIEAMRSTPPSQTLNTPKLPPPPGGIPMTDTTLAERQRNTIEALREALERSISDAESLRNSNSALTAEVVDLTHSHARLVHRVRELEDALKSALSGHLPPAHEQPAENMYADAVTESYDVHSAPTPPRGSKGVRHGR